MATRPVPVLIVEAAARHVCKDHGIERFDASQVGMPSTRSARCLVSWDRKGPAGGTWFHCRLCPPGFNRYSAELGLREPTPRIAELIRVHQDQHCDEGATSELRELAPRSYRPMSPASGAAICCAVCTRAGRDPVLLTDPPLGDARRIRLLLEADPALAARVAGMSSIEQAMYVESEDRRALERAQLGVPRPVLRRANGVAQSAPTACLDDALLRWMLAETTGERGITTVIAELDRLALDDPEEFGCRLGAHVPALARPARSLPREHFAQRVADHFGYPAGRFPIARQTGLWRVWKAREP
jgi:hypothetical protein